MKAHVLLCLAIGLSTAASAAVIQDDNSDYGQQGADCTDTTQSAGFLCDLTKAPGLFGEQFSFSGNSNFNVNFHVWDFEVISHITNFTLTLAGSLPFVADKTLDGNNRPTNGFGMFVCGSDETPVSAPNSHDRLCTPSDADLSAVTSSPAGSDGTGSTVRFTVPGDGNGFVFFVVERVTGDPTVTATLTSAPEPGSFSLFIVAGLAVLGRRRLANLL